MTTSLLRRWSNVLLVAVVLHQAPVRALSETWSSSPPVGQDQREQTPDQNLESAFFWTLIKPLATHAGMKAIDYLFSSVIPRFLAPTPPASGRGAMPPAAPPAAPAQAPSDGAVAKPDPSTAAPTNPVGFAYRLFRLSSDGTEALVGPREVFHAGDRIVVRFIANLPGVLEVSNLDAAGKVQDLGRAHIQAGRAARIGPFQFYGTPGVDTLILKLSPCKRRASDGTQDSLRLSYGNVSMEVDEKIVAALPACASARESKAEQLESLRVVTEQTGYSVRNNASLQDISRPHQAYVTRIPLSHQR